ncbi:MAG: diacylglycerol kinase family protein [Eubacteriales bacterium]|nr:diacylglycerol kinase family protein [Eubacteriales bacterium]
MEHIFLLNPAAGNGRTIPRLVPQIRAASAQTGIPYTLYETRSPGDGASLVARCATTRKRYRFYACGGDGTLNEAVRGAIHQKNIEVASIPCGTGNDFVRNLGGRQRFLDLVSQLRGHAVPVDAIVSHTGEVAINGVNIGLDCNIADGAGAKKNLPFVSGMFAYLLSIADELHRPLGQTMAISTDDGEMQVGKYLLCAIGNGGYCGSGFHALPHADVTDGKLDFTAVRTLPRREILSLLPRYYAGTHLSSPLAKKYIQTKTCRRVHIRTTQPVRVSFDGEIIRTNSLRLHVAPGAVQFCIPN